MTKREKEINTIIDNLKKLWLNFPDQRLCQLISNLHGVGVQDIFWTQDEDLLKVIHQQLDEVENEN